MSNFQDNFRLPPSDGVKRFTPCRKRFGHSEYHLRSSVIMVLGNISHFYDNFGSFIHKSVVIIRNLHTQIFNGLKHAYNVVCVSIGIDDLGVMILPNSFEGFTFIIFGKRLCESFMVKNFNKTICDNFTTSMRSWIKSLSLKQFQCCVLYFFDNCKHDPLATNVV